jgi:hypothetical protein
MTDGRQSFSAWDLKGLVSDGKSSAAKRTFFSAYLRKTVHKKQLVAGLAVQKYLESRIHNHIEII